MRYSEYEQRLLDVRSGMELDRRAAKETSMQHDSTFDHVKPTEVQVSAMQRVREAAKTFADVLERELPEGPDKTFVQRNHRTTAMWANVTITRQPDGSPRW